MSERHSDTDSMDWRANEWEIQQSVKRDREKWLCGEANETKRKEQNNSRTKPTHKASKQAVRQS